MIYKSIDTIPAKVYFKILETLDYSLLCEGGEKLPNEELIKIFESIIENDDTSAKDKGKSKELDIYCRIEMLSAKYKKVKFSIYYLKLLKDDDLIEMLKQDGYKFTDDYERDLDTIERLVESLLIKIEAVKNRLPKKQENEEKEDVPFDEVVLSYCALLGMGFVDTNKIVLSQYRAIVRMGNNKIEKLNKVHDGRK